MAKILIACPNIDEAELYAYALRFAGHQVTVIDDREKTFQMTQSSRVDLLLLDVDLLGSLDQVHWQELALNPGALHSDVIYLLEGVRDASLVKMLNSSGQQYINKPVSLDMLTKQVNHHLKNRQS